MWQNKEDKENITKLLQKYYKNMSMSLDFFSKM